MSERISYDRELAAVLPTLSGYVPVGMALSDLNYFRQISSPSREEFLQGSSVDCVDHAAVGHCGNEMTVSIISKPGHSRPRQCIYFLHGGGMVMGNRFAGARPLIDWAVKHDVVCVTPEYRLAPEFPAPIPVEDCYAGLVWLVAHAAGLNVDPNRILIFGGSGGGGLAAGVSLLARDRNGPNLIGQLLQCPMIDDRNNSKAAIDFDGVGVWDTSSNKTAWKAVLGDQCDGSEVSQYSAPARATDLSNLPPTYIDVGAMEVFRDEDIAYASGIMQAGGDCELHVWGGAFHGFYDIAPDSAVSRACISAREVWLERILRGGKIEAL